MLLLILEAQLKMAAEKVITEMQPQQKQQRTVKICFLNKVSLGKGSIKPSLSD